MLTRLGMGCAHLGQEYRGHKVVGLEAEGLLAAAYVDGIRHFDTAASYGESEDIIAKVFAGDNSVSIATKVSNLSQAEKSIRKFGSVDILYIHNFGSWAFELAEDLSALKKHGDIHYLGATTYDPYDSKLAENWGFDIVQAPVSLIDRRHLDICRDVRIIARSVLLGGKLLPIADHAIRWVLHNRRITSTLVGIKSREELEFSLRCLKAGPVTMDEVCDLRK